ncbi:MAG: hypothetical protein KDB14_18220 [Planctomycetales bacterium]|nr:hypothetical protein [Planctomycetales bacterium]
MTQFPCPRCGVERETLNSDCAQCGWSAAPERTPHKILLPRRIGKFEWLGLGTLALLGAALGAVRGGMFGGLRGALVLGVTASVYFVTVAVLAFEIITAFAGAGRPKFSLRGMFIFTTVWAILLFVMRLLSPRTLMLAFAWPAFVESPILRALLMVFLQMLAWSWLFTVPLGVTYNTIGLSRHRPSPILGYVFLSSVLWFLTLAMLPLIASRFWPTQMMVAALLMLGAAIAFAIECVARNSENAHWRRAAVAIAISLQNYLVVALIMGGVPLTATI